MCYFLLQSFLNILMSHVSVFLCKKHNKDIYTTAFYHRLSSWLWCNTTTLLHLFQHQLIHTADPIMSAGRDSFRGLESIIDSVGCVLFDSKFIFFQLEEKGICKRVWGGGMRNHSGVWGNGSVEQVQRLFDLEVLVMEEPLQYDWNKHGCGKGWRWSCWGSWHLGKKDECVMP